MNTTQLLDVKDVARMLSISTRAVYHLAENRKIPTVKWGKSVRFRPIDIAKFVDDHIILPRDYEAEADTLCVCNGN